MPSNLLPDGRLLYRFAIAEHLMHTRLDAELSKLRLTITGYSVLLLVEFLPGISASELARRILLAQQSAARLTARLVRIGYLRRAADPSHGRMINHRLTPRGRRALAAADAIVEHWEQTARRCLGPAGTTDLLNGIEQFRSVFSDNVA